MFSERLVKYKFCDRLMNFTAFILHDHLTKLESARAIDQNLCFYSWNFPQNLFFFFRRTSTLFFFFFFSPWAIFFTLFPSRALSKDWIVLWTENSHLWWCHLLLTFSTYYVTPPNKLSIAMVYKLWITIHQWIMGKAFVGHGSVRKYVACYYFLYSELTIVHTSMGHHVSFILTKVCIKWYNHLNKAKTIPCVVELNFWRKFK